MKSITCPTCAGTGSLPDPAYFAATMRARRNRARLSVSEVARRMGITKSYLSDMERGRRGWPAERIAAFREALRHPLNIK